MSDLSEQQLHDVMRLPWEKESALTPYQLRYNSGPGIVPYWSLEHLPIHVDYAAYLCESQMVRWLKTHKSKDRAAESVRVTLYTYYGGDGDEEVCVVTGAGYFEIGRNTAVEALAAVCVAFRDAQAKDTQEVSDE